MKAGRSTDEHAAPTALDVLFFMRAVNYGRHFESVIRGLAGRGHRVHLAFDIAKKGQAGDTSLVDAICADFPDVSYGMAPGPRDDWKKFAAGLRCAIDYLRYLTPDLRDFPAVRERARVRAPSIVTRAAHWPGLRTRGGRALLNGFLRGLERALPVSPDLVAYVAEREPDLVLVSPLVGLGSPQGDYVRAARSARIPTALLVASWDNLTNKGVVRDVPDLTVVWNDSQVDEAVALHGIPRERTLAAGAHTYDHWFDWEPSTTREKFCETLGLPPDRPIVLYVGSSAFIAPDERRSTAEWLRQLRQCRTHSVLRDVSVLVRPHPANARMWEKADLSEFSQTVVWPPLGATPTDARSKSDYYDSIYHAAAVVGINTSALIESTIVGRPVLTLLTAEYRDTQQGTWHFKYLPVSPGGGFLNLAHSFDEHAEQLAEAIESPAPQDGHGERFIATFVRPHGRQNAAAPEVVGALETLVTKGVKRLPRAPWRAPLRFAMRPVARCRR